LLFIERSPFVLPGPGLLEGMIQAIDGQSMLFCRSTACTAFDVASRRLPGSRTPAILPFALFTAVQVADAWLTVLGLARFGVTAEGNPLVALCISVCGVTTGLIAVKAMAIAAGALLLVRAEHLILTALTVVFVFAAVVPWAWALAA
jgi:hypothetical protein